ncbi:hypothetical protein TWF696_008569 [Orbilia brochopaga]|uniref:WSC domain-containing protein n=1 Tax=Orbilia brochopaga TaxID=3140254 RepID=A0AAV9UJM6_9PEZI
MKIEAVGVFSCFVAAANARAIVVRADAPVYSVEDVLSALSDPAQVSTPEPFCSSILSYRPATETVTTTTTGATSVTYTTDTTTLSTKTVTLGTFTVTDTFTSTATNTRTTLTATSYITQAPALLVKRAVTPAALRTFPGTLLTSACSEYITTTSTTTKYAQTKFTPVETRTRTQTVRTFTTTIGGTTETVTSTTTWTTISTSTATATVRLPAGQAAPTTYPGGSGWVYQSCIQDSFNSAGHALQGPYGATGQTPAQCIVTCQGLGFSLAGVQYGGECWCGNTILNGNGPAPEGECSKLCTSDNTMVCGNSFRMSLYARTGEATDAPIGPVAFTDFSVLKPFRYKGCYAEPPNQRAMKSVYTDPTGMTVQKCIQYALSKGATKCGVEYGGECWYDTVLASGHKKEETEALCNKPCPGDSQTACGGNLHFSYYSQT